MHIMCHSMVKNHNYGNTPLLNGEIEEIEGCQCSQTQPFFGRERMCENHSALLGHKTKKYYLFYFCSEGQKLFRGTSAPWEDALCHLPKLSMRMLFQNQVIYQGWKIQKVRKLSKGTLILQILSEVFLYGRSRFSINSL